LQSLKVASGPVNDHAGAPPSAPGEHA